MCNLFGAYNVSLLPNKPLFPPNLESLEMRGRDSCGMTTISYSYRPGQLAKQVAPSLKSLLLPDDAVNYVGLLCRAIPEPEWVGHEKEGLNHDRDTQPFNSDRWVVSHNGTVIKPEEIIKRYELNPTTPVDSGVLPGLLERFISPIEAFKKIDGSFALVAYDIYLHNLYLMTNFQPLYYVETPDYIYYASLPEQLEVLETNFPVQKVPPYTAVIFKHVDKKKEQVSLYKKEPNKRVLVVASGGLDSMTTARLYQVLGYEVSLIHFLYGQAAETVELKMLKKTAEFYGWPCMVMDLRETFKEAAKSSRLLNKTVPQNDALEDAEGMPSYVGNRNMIFSSIAAGIAEEQGIGRVVLGLNLSDGSAYPDNGLPFLFNMEETLKTSLNQQSQVLYRSPFTNLMKNEILRIAIAIGASLPWHASCYYPKLQDDGLPIYCTGCGSHLLRYYAFKRLGLIDPVPYEEKVDWGGCKELPEDFYERMYNKDFRLELKEIPFSEQIARTL